MLDIKALEDKIKGCMIGGALGDAFGYPVEMLTLQERTEKYDPDGFTDYEIDKQTGKYLISDDTQMSMFSLEALNLCQDKDKLLDNVYKSYLRWFDTQFGPGAISPDIADTGILHKEESMFRMRCPGHACISSLRKGIMGTIDNPINISKGNGCVMRAAPFGFLINEPPEYIYELSKKAAAITHGDEEAQECAAAFSLLIYYLLKSNIENDQSRIIQAYSEVDKFYSRRLSEESLAQKAYHKGFFVARKGERQKEYFHVLGEGWIAPEALAWATFAAVDSKISYGNRLWILANYANDSDTVASIFGNIWGACHGLSYYFDGLYNKLEHKDLIMKLCDDFIESHWISSASPKNKLP